MVAVPAAIDRNLVSRNEDLPQPSQFALDLLPNKEECGSRSVLFQYPEECLQPETRPVIESERHRAFAPGRRTEGKKRYPYGKTETAGAA